MTRLRGDVFINDSKAKIGDLAKSGDILNAKGKNSFVQIKEQDSSVILLKDGKMIIRKNTTKESEISQISGILFHYLNPQKKKKFIIKTKNATFGIRGTKYFISEYPDKSYLCVCEGEVEGIDLSENESYSISKDQDLYIYSNKPAKKAAATNMMSMMGDKTFKEMGYPVNN